MDPLYQRRVGRLVLMVYPRERSTLLQGRGRTLSGTTTVYDVVAAATKGRHAVRLGESMPDLASAVRYAEEYRIEFGLVTKH